MKLTTKGKVWLTGLFTSPVLAVVLGLGLASPAIAPAPANALTLEKFEGAKFISDKGLVELLKATGFKGQSLKYAWAIAKKESQGRPLDFDGNLRTGDKSYGLFQINMLGAMGAERRAYYGIAENADLLNPVTNAKIAYLMSDEGKDWSPWKGTHTVVVQYYLKQYPYKTPVVHKVKAKGKPKPKK